MTGFGRTSCGRLAQEAYHPTIKSFARDLDQARAENCKPSTNAPLPEGWDFHIDESQLVLEPDEEEYPSFKSAFGFVARIADSSRNDAASPLMFTIAPELPFKYGFRSGGTSRSWAFCRVVAFSPKCILCGDPSSLRFKFFGYSGGGISTPSLASTPPSQLLPLAIRLMDL